MTNFEDRLISDLIEEHGSALATLERPVSRRRSGRPLWIAGGAVAIAGATAIGITLVGGGTTPAYAVTENPNGTVTLSLADMTGITGANAELRRLGLPVLVVAFGRACADQSDYDTANGNLTDDNGQFTFSLAQIPAADTLVVAAKPMTVTQGVPMPPKGGLKAIVLSANVAKGRPPAC